MSELSHAEFRDALENAMKGTMAKDAPFSRAWATGKLQRHHFVAGDEPLPLHRPVRRLPRVHVRPDARHRPRRQGLPAAEHVGRGAERCPPHRLADPLRRGMRRTREYVMDRKNAMPFTKALQGWLYYIAANEHFAVSSAALIVGLESQVPSIYRASTRSSST